VSIGEAGGFRRVAPPLVLFLAVSGLVFGLAKLHLARPGLPKAVPGQKIRLGDFYNGQTVFNTTCAACHGRDGKGGPAGPKLDGLQITLARAKLQIDGGGTTMPPRLVSGGPEADVLAFLATILGKPG
jgi:mono/diheme cytochrome c family protein